MTIINTRVDMLLSLTKNKFVQLAIEKTIKLGYELKGATAIEESVSNGLDIAIVGDNDFYSQRATVSTCRLVHSLSPCSLKICDSKIRDTDCISQSSPDARLSDKDQTICRHGR